MMFFAFAINALQKWAARQLNASNGVVRELRIDPVTAMLVFEPSMDENKRIAWACTAEGIRPTALPQDCR